MQAIDSRRFMLILVASYKRRLMLSRILRRTLSSRDDLLSFIEVSVKQILTYHNQFAIESFDSQKPFKDLGITDLEKSRLVYETENHFDVDLTDHEFLSINTPFDLICLINKYISVEYALTENSEKGITGSNVF